MDTYLPKVQYHSENEWRYRRTTADPALSRVASLLRAYEVEQGRRRRGGTRRRAVQQWVGERLIRAGQRLTVTATSA